LTLEKLVKNVTQEFNGIQKLDIKEQIRKELGKLIRDSLESLEKEFNPEYELSDVKYPFLLPQQYHQVLQDQSQRSS
jgi:hypothetical protein